VPQVLFEWGWTYGANLLRFDQTPEQRWRQVR
jgi:hypothetical protein